MQTDRDKWGRRVRWALGLSLAVNLLLIGALAGAGYRHAGGPGARERTGPGAMSYAMPYMQALPRAERRAMRQQMQGQDTPSRDTRRAQFQQMLAALRAAPFDAAAVRAVLDAQQAAGAAVQASAQAAWLDRVTRMDDTARASYADALEDVLARGPRRAKRRD